MTTLSLGFSAGEAAMGGSLCVCLLYHLLGISTTIDLLRSWPSFPMPGSQSLYLECCTAFQEYLKEGNYFFHNHPLILHYKETYSHMHAHAQTPHLIPHTHTHTHTHTSVRTTKTTMENRKAERRKKENTTIFWMWNQYNYKLWVKSLQ